jgi:hypothetical protein
MISPREIYSGIGHIQQRMDLLPFKKHRGSVAFYRNLALHFGQNPLGRGRDLVSY